MNSLEKLLAAADRLAAAADILGMDPKPNPSPSGERLADALAVYQQRRKDYSGARAEKPPKPKPEPSAEGLRFAEWARKSSPAITTEGQLKKWALCFDRLTVAGSVGGYTAADVARIWTFARTHEFYRKVVLSPLKLTQLDAQGIRWIARLADVMKSTQPTIPSGQVPLKKL
jgi:hypothetical protein